MRSWLSMFVLACFLPQQFLCCGENCGSCAESEHPAEAHAVCGHDHPTRDHRSHDDDSGGHQRRHDDGSPVSNHHLCVAAHLFYVARGNDGVGPSQPSAWQVIVAASIPVRREMSGPGSSPSFEASKSPLDSRQARALRQVWIV